MLRFIVCALGLLTTLPALARSDERVVQHGLRLPAGFEVVEFADSKLANDIYTMTVDPHGRIVVAGRGYIRVLVDDDNDGRADRAIDFADTPKDGAMGLLWEGQALYVTGDGGLRRYHDRNGDGRADGPSELIRAMKTGGEHAAHALRRGPDGWLYVLCGNNTNIDKSYADLPTSPIREPVAGCVLRLPPDLKGCEIVADGYRNPYGMDFNQDGELFTYDSDNERCVSLPWYEPTRFYHVVPGRHYGWLAPQRASFWRLPPYFLDVVAPVTTLGRGSPTGVACYRHVQFPARYRGGMFALDWTFGKVHFLTLRRQGATYTCEKEVFLESVGENGFAPTAAVVHPQSGDLYLSIGGRGTRGAVYRIRYPKGLSADVAQQAESLRPAPQSLDWRPGSGAELLKQAGGGDALVRLRALTLLRRHADHLQPAELRQAVRAGWGESDRLLRNAAADLIALLPQDEQRALAAQAKTPWEQTSVALARHGSAQAEGLEQVDTLVTATDQEPAAVRLDGVRLVQLALGGLVARKHQGDVWAGYSPRKEVEAGLRLRALPPLRQAFPAGQADLDRELSRTLAVLQDEAPQTLQKVADHLGATADPIDKIHYLIVLARLQAPRPAGVTQRVADTLLALDREMTAKNLNRDSHWPLRISELYAELARKDPALNDALLAHKEFGRADHVLFAQVPGFDQRRAARLFLARARADKEYPWNAALVKVLGALSDEEALPVLRGLWGKSGLDAALLPALARQPRPEDRAKFVAGLTLPDPATVRVSLDALKRLPRQENPAETVALITSLGRLQDSKQSDDLRRAIVAYLQQTTGEIGLGADRQAWSAWLGKRYPQLAARLRNPDGVDVAAWERRRRGLDWTHGDAERGRAVFVKASCVACHSGGQALGPDLNGVAGRFSRDDLFTAIVQPSRDVSARYQTTLIETAEGKLHQGLVIYEAVDGILLQTATGTVRIAGEQIATRRFSPLSLMPAGLLDGLSDREVADLYTYLRSLGASAGQPARKK